MLPQLKQDRSGLRWTRTDIEQTLTEARTALEDFTDGNHGRLAQCVERLHHLHGVLEMVQVYGAAMLADEMERLAEALFQGQVKRPDGAAEALMLGLVQLPAYLEKIESGAADVPLALLPLMNDLRAAREAALVSESSLFAPKLDAIIAAETVRPGSGNRDLPRMVNQARTHYHRALLHLIRDQDAETALVQIRDLLHLIGNAAGTARLRRLLAAAEALAIVVLADSAAPSLAVKPLFGKLDRVFKRIIDQGEEVAMLDFPVDILKNILFYVSRTDLDEPLVAAVRQGADLGAGNDDAAMALGSLGGPNRELFRAVGEALGQDLRDVKDQLDLYIRSDRGQPERLTGLARPVQKIADTLGMVGRGDLRTRLRRRCDELRGAESRGEGLDEDRMMALASDLLAVDSALAGLSSGDAGGVVDGADSDDGSQSLSRGELQQHVHAALDEALVELARAKEGLLDFLEGAGQTGVLGDVRVRLHAVAGVLNVVALAEAGRLLTGLEPYLEALGDGRQPPPDESQRDAIADVVVGTELYMRGVLEPGVDPAHLLRHAQSALERLGLADSTPAAAQAHPVEPESFGPGTPSAGAEVVELEFEGEAASAVAVDAEIPEAALPVEEVSAAATTVDAVTLVEEASEALSLHPVEDAAEPYPAVDAPVLELTLPEPEVVSAAQAGLAPAGSSGIDSEPAADLAVEPAAAASAPEAGAPADEIDAEILEVFGEEAEEELAQIQACYPRWRDDPNDRDALATMRRSFHTLKGSGRIVGALNIGEFAWAIENLLNRVIDGTVVTSTALFGLLDEAVGVLPGLVAESRNPGSPQTDVSALSQRIAAVAAGAGDSDGEPEMPVEAAAAAEQTDTTAGMDETVAPAPVAEDVPSGSISLVDETLEPVEESILTATDVVDSQLTEVEVSPADSPDSSLSAVFHAELDGHLGVLAAFVEHCSAEPASCVMQEGVMRAMHTLRGSAGAADNEPIAAIAAGLERLSNVLLGSGAILDGTTLELLREGHRVLERLGLSLDHPAQILPDWTALRDEIEAAAAALARAPAPADVSDEATGAGLEDLDPELLEVFLEEAKELLEALESELGAWQYATSDDPGPVARLQRTLHTIKGGARLSGIMPVGDLSHAMESAFESVVEQRVAADPRLKQLIRHAADALAQDVELVQEGRMPPAHKAFIERLEAAAKGREWPDLEAGSGSAVEAEAPAVPEPAVFPAELEQRLDAAAQATVPADAVSDSLTEAAADEVVAQAHVPVAEAQPWEAEPVPPAEPVAAAVPEDVAQDVAQTGESELPEDLGEDSELLTDSQLMTDSELLGDSSFLVAPPPGLDRGGDAVVAPAAKVFQFPLGEQVEAEGFVPRRPMPEEEVAPAPSGERVRVAAEVLDQMVNNAGEVSIYRARIEQQNNVFAFNLEELGRTIDRLRGQLRDLELETEAQVLSRHEREGDRRDDFDPLELDRYSAMQQLSRALSETVEDLSNLGQSLSELSRDTDTLLLQQSRVNTDLQDSLLRTRMVKFASRVPRLERVVRQTAHSVGKQAVLEVQGGEQDMDRAILERMMSPLEHLLRNAVSHGIEEPEARAAAGKPAEGRVRLELAREGADVVLVLADDGAGLDRDRIRAKALERGLIDERAVLEDADLYRLILEHGFSTARELSQVSGRGVGMDVVVTEVKQLGGSLDIASEPGAGTLFTIRLPFTLAITDALLVSMGDDIYAVPHSSMDGVVRIDADELRAIYAGERSGFRYGDREYQVRYLGSMLGSQAASIAEGARWLPMLLVRSGEHRVAIQVDGLLGNRQIVVKSVGAQLSTVRWFTGGTILADGQIALILDVNSLVRMDSVQQPAAVAPMAETRGVTVMVVDDSITVRKVTSRLLERHNMQVITAKDGVDAVTMLQEHRPDVMLLDIEMPRMDGYELARHMRSTPELKDIPIIMITSRTGDKHRNRALELGVRRYLGKPYQEAELLENIYTVLADAAR